MQNKIYLCFLAFLFATNLFAQNLSSQTQDSTIINKLDIINPEAIIPFFKDLSKLEKKENNKVRIIQVGDSHIQADFATNITKDILQQQFGNAGLGFIFPHKLAKTNGTTNVNFKTNATFLTSRNVRPANENFIGISGYSLATNNNNAVIQVAIKDYQNFANSIKIITPNNENSFLLGLNEGNDITFQKTSAKVITHKIKAKETLVGIAKKYNVTVENLKRYNNLNTNKLTVGKTIKIETAQPIESEINTSDLKLVNLLKDKNSHSYNSKDLLETFYLISDKEKNNFALSGLLLENKSSGVTFSGIGVNGAKLSDYNNFEMFFNQMQALSPNLIIISLGTNESFDRLDATDYLFNLELFLTKLKNYNPNVSVLVTTPPPSTLHKKFENTYIAAYTNEIIAFANNKKSIAVFDLYSALGGENGVTLNKQKGFLAKDEVHYTKSGYEEQGQILASALLKAYKNYISNK